MIADIYPVVWRPKPPAVIADLSATMSCDHSGTDALARVYQRAAVSGTSLQLVVASPVVRRALSIAGTDRLVSVYPSLEAALAARAPTEVTALAAQVSPGAATGQSADLARRLSDDRDRIVASLNDLVVRRLFSAGLSLQAALRLLGDHPAAAKVDGAVLNLDLAITALRDIVFHQDVPAGSTCPRAALSRPATARPGAGYRPRARPAPAASGRPETPGWRRRRWTHG